MHQSVRTVTDNYGCQKEKEKNQYMDKIRKIDEENKDKNKIVLNELFPEKVYKEIEPNEVEKQITDTKKSGISQIIMDILEKIKSIFNK